MYWKPRIWGPDETVQKFVVNTTPFPYNVTKLKVLVSEASEANENESYRFLSNFEKLETSWTGTEKNITKVSVNQNDPYFASLLAATILSHFGGLSRKHLIESNETPKIITSIAKYYVYYHLLLKILK